MQYDNYPFKKNTFKQYLKDSCYVEKFDIEKAENDSTASQSEMSEPKPQEEKKGFFARLFNL